jgi:hypothetical protein
VSKVIAKNNCAGTPAQLFALFKEPLTSFKVVILLSNLKKKQGTRD